MDLEEKIKSFPRSPGVYLMKDQAGKIIYVGKAVNLKNRVRSYFHRSSPQTSPKTRRLVEEINDIEFIESDRTRLVKCAIIKAEDGKPKCFQNTADTLHVFFLVHVDFSTGFIKPVAYPA